MAKIDFVVPLVFPDDKYWLTDYRNSPAFPTQPSKDVRFRSWGTEELLLKCVERYMPWLNQIHILLARESQAKDWMRGYHIVYHKDFIPEHLLPSFNVCTFEMWLHKIPNLSEQFIYSNDDFFPLSPLKEEDFFQDGLPCLHHDERPYPEVPNIFHRFVMNGLNMVASDFGKHFTNTWLRGGHSMMPMLRSTVEHVCTTHAQEISKCFTPNRSAKNYNQYIFSFYQHISGKYVDHAPKRRYIGQSQSIDEMIDAIRDKNAGIVCINDHENILDWEVRAEIAREEIAKKLELI